MVMLATQTPEPTATADETRKIFIVEDEEVTAFYIRRQLEKLDYHVSGVAASGEKAISALEQHRSDLVLMDLKLAGELSGAETAKIIQERFHIPVVYLTAYSDAATVKELGETGGPGFLTKPLRVQDLQPAIQLAMARNDKQQQLERERKAWQDLCRISQEQLEQFTYAAGHDLQEPLRTASCFMDLLERRSSCKLDNEERKLLAEAKVGLARMNTLLHDLLGYAQAGFAKGAPIPEVPSAAALNSALDNLQGAIAESGARVTHDPLPIVRADPSQLSRVFQNLLANSIKFRHPNVEPQVRVGVANRNNHWVFRIEDNGIGFDQQYAARIFAPFKRLNHRVTYSGTGVGLAICKKIIEAHGGEIWAESAPGNGAIFFFTLPAL
jgi:signal transduction histidine kinase